MSEKESRGVSRFLARVFLHDKLRKIIALTLALVSYALIQTTTGREQAFFKVPVTLEMPDALINMDNSALTLESVMVRTSDRRLRQLTTADFRVRARVKYENYRSGQPYRLTISPEDVKVPLDVTVLAVTPHSFELTLEARVSKKLPVRQVFSGLEEMPDYNVGRVTFTPAEVTLTGPESAFYNLEYVETEPIPLSGNVTESFEYKARLAPRDRMTITPEEATASIEIFKAHEAKAFENVPLSLLVPPGMDSKFVVELESPPFVTVTVYGLRGALAVFDEKSLRAYADLTGIDQPGSYAVEVNSRAAANPNLIVRKVEPQQVKVKLTLKKR